MRRGSCGLRLRSLEAVSMVQAARRRLGPGLARAAAFVRGAATRLAAIDLVPRLITLADRIETGVRWCVQAGRRLLPRRGLGLGGTFAWRCAAALAGIGLTAALVTSLSAKDEDRLRLASLSLAATEAGEQPGAPTRRTRTAVTAEDWVSIPRPMAVFSLEAPELGREPSLIEARRSQDGERREDLLSFGSFAGPKPHLALRLATGEGAAASARSFMVALATEAALSGLAVERTSTPAPIETRFGLLEAADVDLANGAESRACVAFRTPPGEARFALSGWWCPAPRPSDRRQLSCLIDRLDLASGGGDQELHALFAGSELKRQPGCAPPRLSASGRRTSWLDVDGNAPVQRMKTAGIEQVRASAPQPKPRPRTQRREP